MIDTWDSINLYRLKRSDIKLAEKAMAMAYYAAEEDFHIKKESRIMKILEKLMHVTLKHAIKNGRVYATTPNFEGIAAWLPDDKIFVSTWQYIRSGILSAIILAGKGWLKRMRIYDKLCKEKHREHANFPHYYLYNLAVHPDHQKKGNASKLLKPILEILDQKGLPCYLETSEHNIPFYEHFGFQVVDKGDLRELNMIVWFMLRKNDES